MCAIDSKYIYVTGGIYDSNPYAVTAKCFKYEIESDLWQDVPSMNHGRRFHSSCQLQGYLYVFFGVGDGDYEKSVEKLPIVSDPVQQAGK